MADGFDPYQAWLGLSKERRPLNAYLLLGLNPGEADAAKIAAAGDERLKRLAGHKQGEHAAQADKLIEMVHEGLKVLQDPKKKAKYDERLRERAAAPADAPPPAATSPAATSQATAAAPLVARAVAPPPATAIPTAAPVAAPVKGALPVAAPVAHPAMATAIPTAAPVGGLPPVVSGPPPVVHSAWPSAGGPTGGAGGALFQTEPPVAVGARQAGKPGPTPTPAPRLSPAEEKSARRQKQLMFLLGLIGAVGALIVVVIVIASSPPTVAKKEPKGQGSATDEEVAATVLDPSTGASKSAETSAAAKASAKAAPGAMAKGKSDANAPAADAAAEAPVAPASEPDKLDWAAGPDPNPSPPLPLDPTLADLLTTDFPAAFLAVDPDQTAAAIASEMGQVAVFDVKNKSARGSFTLRGEKVLALALPAADRVLVWSEPGGLQTVNAADGIVLVRWSAPVLGGAPTAGIAISPAGKYAAIVRNGIRFYDSTSGALVGVAPVPEGAAATAIGFDPEGQRLRAVLQSAESHRLVDYDLNNGQPVNLEAKSCPGELKGPGFRGPLYTRSGSGGRFLYCGRYVLKGDDGFPAVRIEKPPAILYPMTGGGLWISDGGPIEQARLDWEKVLKSVTAFDQARTPPQIGPGASIAIKLAPEGMKPERAALVEQHIVETLTRRFEGYNMTVNSFAATKCTVKYKEEPAGASLNALRFVAPDGKTTQKSVAVEGVKTTIGFTITNTNVGKEDPVYRFNIELPASSARMAAPAASADKEPDAAYLDARLAWVDEQFAGLDLPFFLSRGIMGTYRLPIVVPGVVSNSAPAQPPADPGPASDKPAPQKKADKPAPEPAMEGKK